jgi:hypothetical protein
MTQRNPPAAPPRSKQTLESLQKLGFRVLPPSDTSTGYIMPTGERPPPAEPPKFTPEELELIQYLSKVERRELSEKEIAFAIDQAKSVGDL